ncbi:MAG: radical SAM protein [Aquificaceae bacterium]|nr:radical SAM protein [Aquificaceae bacterium]
MDLQQRIRLMSRLASFEREEEPDFESCIFHASTPKGKVPILKLMQTTMCDKNCVYCAFRRDREETVRMALKPEEVAKGFMELYRAGKVKGLFLSSGIFGNPEFTMERMIDSAKILREKYGFRGYIHLKLMPGASLQTVEEAVRVASRVSINLETSKEERLKQIAKGKSILKDMLQKIEYVDRLIRERSDKSQITQMMVGVGEEKDREIIKAVDFLNRRFKLSRVYFSAFFPVPGTPLENRAPENPIREHRLYQIDFLIREYQFGAEDFEKILRDGNLPLDKDPKTAWAEANPHLFPVELNTADYETLIRVPGIGKKTAKELIRRRKEKRISSPIDLKGIRNLHKILRFTLLNGRSFYQPIMYS